MQSPGWQELPGFTHDVNVSAFFSDIWVDPDQLDSDRKHGSLLFQYWHLNPDMLKEMQSMSHIVLIKYLPFTQCYRTTSKFSKRLSDPQAMKLFHFFELLLMF